MNFKTWMFREKDISYPFKCRLCIRAFKSLPSLEQHLRRHEGLVTESLPFGCLKCNKAAFKTASQQEKHQAREHYFSTKSAQNSRQLN